MIIGWGRYRKKAYKSRKYHRHMTLTGQERGQHKLDKNHRFTITS